MSDERRTIHMPDDVFPYFSDDPEFINEQIQKEPPLCMVLNKDLSDMAIFKAVTEYYVFLAEYNGEQCYVVAGGFYRNKQVAFDKMDPKLTVHCSAARKWVNSGARDTPVLEQRIDDPLSILINQKLEKPRVKALEHAYETLDIEHEGKPRTAIACIYLDPNYNPGPGRVLGQFTKSMEPALAEG